MAPRKTDKPSNEIKNQVNKAAVKKTTRNVKTPTVIKLAIPGSADGFSGRKLSKKNQLSFQDKIALANEVSKAQSLKILPEEPQSKPQDTVTTRSRSKCESVLSKFSTNAEEQSTLEMNTVEAEECPPVKKTYITRKKVINKKTEIKTEPIERPRRKLPTKKEYVGVKRCLRNTRLDLGKVSNSSDNIDICEVKQAEDNKEINNELLSNKRSPTTSISNLSWIRDISNSSANTVTPVTNNDFVCIDNRIPILTLNSIDKQLRCSAINSNNSQDIDNCRKDENKDNLNTDSSSSSSSDSSSSSTCTSSLNIEELDLSKTTDETPKDKDPVSDLLEQVDLTDIDWPGNDICELNLEMQQKITRVLDIERDIILVCKQLRKILDDKDEEDHQKDDKFLKPAEVDRPLKPASSSNNKDVNNFAIFKNKINQLELEKHNQTTDNTVVDKNKILPFDGYDDDALSLFAESITGIESSKASVHEPISKPEAETSEYIPRPVNNRAFNDKYEYCPTKIDGGNRKAICEKQNADSTSIHKDFELSNISNNDLEPSNEIPQSKPSPVPTSNVNQTVLSINEPVGFWKSKVLKEFCFFNLMQNCKNDPCRFKHVEPDPIDVGSKLTSLSDTFFIKDYMSIRTWPILLQKYGIVYFEECMHRNLTRILLEMVIDFYKAAFVNPSVEDVLITIAESALLYLNNLDLTKLKDSLDDLFLSKLNNDRCLCDFFMQTIAETQNFSRFKSVFLYLTFFIVKNGGSFRLDVAEHLLERISIFPNENSLCYALYDIITRTDVDIFKNKIMSRFEQKLREIDQNMLNNLLAMKDQAYASQLVGRNSFGCSSQMQTTEPDKESYASPDTTNMDTMANPVEPVIKRTIAFQPIMSSSVKERAPKTFQNWQQQNKFHKMHAPRGIRPLMAMPIQFPRPTARDQWPMSRPNRPVMRPNRPVMRPNRPMMRPNKPVLTPPMMQRQVSYRASPSSGLNVKMPPRNF